LAGASPIDPLWELTALLQTPCMDLRKPTSKGREGTYFYGEGRREK